MKTLICAAVAAAVTCAAPMSVWAQGPPAPPRQGAGAPAKPPEPVRRTADGKPDFTGFYQSDAGGANYGLERHPATFLNPPGRGVITDPPDGKLPVRDWAKKEVESRARPERGYDDPTAHCFVAGVPRSMYVPAPFQIIQTPTHFVFLHERMAWRVIPLDGRPHLPDHMRLWQGDSVGRWEGDTLVIESRNFNGKTWLNEVGEMVSHAQTVVERLTPVHANQFTYQATVTDPIVYTRPWTMTLPVNRQEGELLEIACHEDNQDLSHLKDVRDEARRKAAEQK